MKSSFVFGVMVVSASYLSSGQDVSKRDSQLHVRKEATVHAPDEQLLGVSSALISDAYDRKAYPQKYSAVYAPVSLSMGRVRTAEFNVSKQSEWYDIMLQFDKPFLLQQMQCMTGTTSGPLDERRCEKKDPILAANWTVWLDGHIVHWGSIPDGCGCIFTAKHFYKLIGSSHLEKGHTYVVQIHFTSDGTPLNVANPHLVIIPHHDIWST